jgi:dihydrofolate reductase
MSRLRVHNFTVSLDGFAAGPRQSPDNPLGQGGLRLHEWIFQTKSMHALQGRDGGEAGVGDDLFRARTVGVGATIMGRNMFGPVRGRWPDESWTGWWGEDPPLPGSSTRSTWRSRPSCSGRASGYSTAGRRISAATRAPV